MTCNLSLEGEVVAVASSVEHEFRKRIKQAITLVEGHGAEGDVHAGLPIQHRYLAKTVPVLPNNRQVHLISSELLADLRSSGFTVIPGDLGENVTTANLNLTHLPLGTRLLIGHAAVVELTGLRTPCSLIDRFQKGLKRAMINKNGNPRFKSGVFGIVRATGEIAPGNAVIVQLPSTWEALPAL